MNVETNTSEITLVDPSKVETSLADPSKVETSLADPSKLEEAGLTINDIVARADEIRNGHLRIQEALIVANRAMKSALIHAREVGEMLIEQQKFIKYGGWCKYVEEQLGFGMRTANNYMKVARSWEQITTLGLEGRGLHAVIKKLNEFEKQQKDSNLSIYIENSVSDTDYLIKSLQEENKSLKLRIRELESLIPD